MSWAAGVSEPWLWFFYWWPAGWRDTRDEGGQGGGRRPLARTTPLVPPRPPQRLICPSAAPREQQAPTSRAADIGWWGTHTRVHTLTHVAVLSSRGRTLAGWCWTGGHHEYTPSCRWPVTGHQEILICDLLSNSRYLQREWNIFKSQLYNSKRQSLVESGVF